MSDSVPSEQATVPPQSPSAAHAEAVTVPPAGGATPQAPGAATPEAAMASERPDVPGYDILGELGRGGMGVVYKARQTKLQRLVALKMIRAGVHAGSEELLRFRIEAEAVAAVQHPNIVQIYEVGEHDGCPFF